MALKDLLSLVDDKLSEVFHKVVYDPTKDRDRFIKRVRATKARFNAKNSTGAVGGGPRDWYLSNNVVQYRPNLSGIPVKINGKEELFVPAERFTQFLDSLVKEVEAGELDAAIEEAVMAKEVGAPKAAPTKRVGNKSGWSPERRAAFDATIKARNAAKQG